MYESLFEINDSLCKAYPSLSPFDVDEKRFVDVINLYIDVIKMQKREKARNDPNRVIRRPATDWF